MQDEGTPAPADITLLRLRHRDWTFGVSWIAAASGPDRRRLWAVKDGIMLSAWSAASLSEQIRQEEAGNQGT